MFDMVDVSVEVLKGIEVFPKGFGFVHGFFIDILVGDDGETEFEVRFKGVLVKRFETISEAFEFVLK